MRWSGKNAFKKAKKINNKTKKVVINMDVCIRGINPQVIKALDESSSKINISREEYLRRALERIVYDDRAMENRYVTQLQKLTQCIMRQQEQLDQIMEYLLMAEQDTISDADELEEYGFPEEGDLDGD